MRGVTNPPSSKSGNTDSGCGLVLFGQAGMGKSSIVHEITQLFHKMNHLTSSFIFSQGEQSEQKAYLLFTTFACHLADRYCHRHLGRLRTVDRNKLGNRATLLYSLYSRRSTGHEALSGTLIACLFCWIVLVFSCYCSGSLYPRTLLRLSPRIPVVVLVTLMSLVAYKC
jgi:hypothetical protein